MNFLKEKIGGKYSATRILLLIMTLNLIAMLWYLADGWKNDGLTFPETFGCGLVAALPIGLLIKEMKERRKN